MTTIAPTSTTIRLPEHDEFPEESELAAAAYLAPRQRRDA
jgi:hypothetical protein